MDFFERQHQAKKKTGYLVFLFCVSVLLISLLNHLLVATVLGASSVREENMEFRTTAYTDPAVAALVFMGTFAVIGLADWQHTTAVADITFMFVTPRCRSICAPVPITL